MRLAEGIVGGSKAIVFTDTIRVKGKNEALRSALKRHLKRELGQRSIAYVLYQHNSESDPNMQVADYCCWAVQRDCGQGDPSRLDSIADLVSAIGNPLACDETPT